MSQFDVSTTGKWILSGEHSVLRGSTALVFPLESRTLKLTYKSAPLSQLNLSLNGEHGEELQLLFWAVLDKACELKKIRRSQFQGEVSVESRIPVGAGLGASAALCVAIAKWMVSMKIVRDEDVPDFARTLENLFHGESSGVDIAVASSGKALKFQRGLAPQELPLRKWSPQLYLSYSGQRGATLECVNQVKALIEKSPELGKKIDAQMAEATGLCERALQLSSAEGFSLLSKGMGLAADCFEQWGLTDGAVQSHRKFLMDHGAQITKPTGSGRGGYVLSLWTGAPPPEIQARLIPCFC